MILILENQNPTGKKHLPTSEHNLKEFQNTEALFFVLPFPGPRNDGTERSITLIDYFIKIKY